MNQQKESDERLRSRRTCKRCTLRACDYQNRETMTTMSGNEQRRNGYEPTPNDIILNGSWINNGRFRNGY